MSDFSSNLRRLRKRAGLSQDALAEKLSVARQTVSSWERGNSYPDLDMLVRISDALRCWAPAFLTGMAFLGLQKIIDLLKERGE